MLDTMSMVMPYLDLCVCMFFTMFLCLGTLLYMLICLDLRSSMFVLSFCMLTHVLHMLMPRSMFLWLDLRFHMFACLDLGFPQACVLKSVLCLLYSIFHVLMHSTPSLRA